jgi:ABC-type Fe3+-hydroxamate transport system substrate-binding protein
MSLLLLVDCGRGASVGLDPVRVDHEARIDGFATRESSIRRPIPRIVEIRQPRGVGLSEHRVLPDSRTRRRPSLTPPDVVPLSPCGTEIVHALGCGDRLFLFDGSAALALPGVGRRLGAPRPATLAEAWRDMRGIADALGVPERGVQLVSQLRRRLRAIGERVGSGPRRRVAVIESLAPLRAPGRWLPELLELAGASDACASAGAEPARLSVAALAAADPDALFVALRGLDLARGRAAIAARGARVPWRRLRAWRERQVFLADGEACFHAPGPRFALTLEVIAEALHPEAFRFGHAGRLWERVGGPTRP